MKKLLILAVISLLLVEQVGYAGASARSKKYSASAASSRAASRNSSSSVKKAGGNADSLITALGFKADDLKDPWSRGVWGFSWKDESKYTFKKDASGKLELDEDGNKIKVELTPDELEDQKNQQIDKVMDVYLGKHASNPVKALAELEKDIQAFQEKFKDVKNTTLQAKIASLVEIAQDAAGRIYNMSIDEKVAEMLVNASLVDALEKAKFELSIADAASKNIYNGVIEQLKIIGSELEKLKRLQGGNALLIAEKMLSSFEKNEDFVQADVYAAIVAQLKLEAQLENEIDNEVIARTAKHSPAIALGKAQEELTKLQVDLARLRKFNNPKDANDRKKIELDIERLNKIITVLQMNIETLELDAATDVKVLLSKHKGDMKKALESIRPPKLVYNPFVKAKPEKVLTPKEQLMVKQLEAMIKQAAQEKLQNDPVAQAKDRLARRDMSNVGSDLKLIVLSPFGLQDKELSEETNAALQEKFQAASKEIAAVAMSKDSVAVKKTKEQAIMKRLSADVGKLIVASEAGIDESAIKSSVSKAKSGNYVGAGLEIGMNKLLNSFSSSNSGAASSAAAPVAAQAAWVDDSSDVIPMAQVAAWDDNYNSAYAPEAIAVE